MNTQPIPISELLSHPFQIHIPDMAGKEWTDFLADVLARGVQDPIRVSNRTGAWVVVDGHQRLRAARECGYTHLTALVQAFADEGEEVTYIAGCFNFHRNSTDAQKTRVAMAEEEYFAKLNAVIMRAGVAADPGPDLVQGLSCLLSHLGRFAQIWANLSR